MQFNNPTILYFLPLLIIPILVHLFQLQKFVKTPFTNVAFLQKLTQEKRKSSRLKKWLVLCNRLLLFLSIFFAFSQPYFSEISTNKKQENYIYLDNSLSTNAKGEKGNLLKIAAQEIIQNASKTEIYSLQTNDNFYKEINFSELKNELLKIKNTSTKIDLNNIFLKINNIQKNKTNTLHNNILISDFQTENNYKFTNVTPSFFAINLKPTKKENISIDSVFINNINNSNITLNIIVKNQGAEKKNIPIAIFNKEKLISKQSFSIAKNTTSTIPFTLQNQENFKGKIKITLSDTFIFDNTFYFTFNSTQKTNILSIGKNTNYLSKIYTKDKFNLTQSTLQNINYNTIKQQQLIILNELDVIPKTLALSIEDFTKKGGNLVVIPSDKLNLNSYNSFLGKTSKFKIAPKITDSLKITNINYNHPLFKNVFSKKVSNFQYPLVESYYPILSKNKSNIVSFENGLPFISELKNNNNSVYIIASSLNKKNSNFLNSPLIVPIFYNFGKLSFQHPKLYYYLADENKIDIETKLKKDEILYLSNLESSFIPQQQTFQNKVNIVTKLKPTKAGFYSITNKKDTLQTLAFNTPKEESLLYFTDFISLKETNKNISVSDSVSAVFKNLNEKNEVRWLWKWFLALAIVSLLLEILILKFYKP